MFFQLLSYRPTTLFRNVLSLVLIISAAGLSGNRLSAEDQSAENAKPAAKSRAFEFNYAATVVNVPPGAITRIWVPVASSNQHQAVELQNVESPTPMTVNKDEKFGNTIGYFELVAGDDGNISVSLKYQATRREVRFFDTEADSENGNPTPKMSAKKFLSADKRVPVDGKPLRLLAGVELPADSVAAGRTLYGLVENHMSYDKSKPGWGEGDSVWACDSRTGNCTDFHSLFISLARSRKFPAKFEIGFPLPTVSESGAISGYHCWAWMHVEGKGWLPVDISEADKHPELRDYYFGNLTADRLAFSEGRDIRLVPESVAQPLNFFVYPHVEVDGKVWDRENVNLDFSFRDVSR